MNRSDGPPNEFEAGKPGTEARDRAEASIEELRQRGGMFVEAVRATRMPMALTDPNLPGNPIVFANEAFLKLSGYRMEEVLGQQPHFMNGRSTDPQDVARFAEALRSDQDDIIETIQYRKDGSRFVATVLLSAFKDDEGRTLNHFMSWLDVTRRAEAESELAELRKVQAALRRSEQRRDLALQAAEMGTWDYDLVSDVCHFDPRAREMYNLPSDRLDNCPEGLARAVHPDDVGRMFDSIQKASDVKGDGRYDIDYRLAKADGEYRWLRVRGQAEFEGEGAARRAVRIVGASRDVTIEKEAEAVLRERDRHSRMLLAELQHRVRNTLAVIRSIVRRTALGSSTVEEFEQHVDGRLSAFARTQAYVTRDPEGGIDLELIVRDELVAHATGANHGVTIEGPKVRLAAEQADTIGLAIHELTSNALKHGALADDGNKVSVSWSVAGSGDKRRLTFCWMEKLNDRALKEPQRTGFGTELLDRIMRYDLDAEPELNFGSDGFSYKVVIPLPHSGVNH